MFRIHTSAERWSTNLLKKTRTTDDELVQPDNPIKTQFDLYYLFLLVGLGNAGTADISKSDISANLKDLTREFTVEFHDYKYIIAGLLLLAELTHSGVSIDKKMVQNKVVDILKSDSPTFLSGTAIDLMNGYAYAGFEKIRDSHNSMPANPTEFLLWYYRDMLPNCFHVDEWN